MMPSVKEPLAGLALLVIFGFLIWYNRPLENPRLFDPYLQDETSRLTEHDAYEAWLWQDPFGFDPDYGSGGAAQAWALAAKGGKRDENFSTAVPAGLTCKDSLSRTLDKEKSIVLAPLVKVAPDTVENKEMRTRQRYAVVAGLVESGYRPKEPGMLHFCSIQEDDSEKDGSGKDDREKDHREYDMRWEHYQHEPNGKSEDASKGRLKPDIVVAWIDSGIVTDESRFPAGLEGISNNFYLFDVGNILEKPPSSVGDQNTESAGVKDGEEGQAGCSRAGGIQFLRLAGMEGKKQGKETQDEEKQVKCNDEASPAPSVQTEKGAGAANKEPASPATGGTGQDRNENASEGTGSEKLAGLLAKELTLRGVTHQSQVMTISELNSENAATLAGNLGECLSKLLTGQKCAKRECDQSEGAKPKSGDSSDVARCSDEIRNVFYLKSVDGKNPGSRDQYGKDKNDKDRKDKDEKGRNESGRADKGEKAPSIELRHSPPLPVGAIQLDYLHRLAEEINNAHHIVDIDKRDSGIRGVVILGSDFHDKLLIIQALREKMPHLLILTTDLDAQMLHPRHWRSTRNLVVASHFDLRLRETPRDEQNEVTEEEKNKPDKPFSKRVSQGLFPPFRDSQQTNIFYRTRSIAEDGAKGIENSAETFPRMFEVGRHGFVRLGAAEKNNAGDYHPSDNTQENTAKELWLLLGIAVSLIIFQWAIRPWSSLYTLYLFIGVLLIFSLAFGFGTNVFSNNELNEPFSFADGVSLWPTLFIQLIVILLALIFILQAMFELDMSSRHLTVRHFPNPPWLRRIRGLNLREGLTFFFLVLSITVYVVNDIYPSGFPFWWCFGPLLWIVAIVYMPRSWKENSTKKVLLFIFLVVAVYALIEAPPKSPTWLFFVVFVGISLIAFLPHHWNEVSIKHWMQNNNWYFSSPLDPEQTLWWQYHEHGLFWPRATRVMAIWLIFALIETLLVYLLPPWPLPSRGATDSANWIDMIHLDLPPWIGVTSFTVTMLLLFFVLDAVRLNFYWIRKLRTQHPLLTGGIPGGLDYLSVPRRLARLENIVSLVAARTQAVDRLIYYPMLCIMLMLLARITYFDNQEFPLSKGITFAVAISFLFFSGFVLRHEANELRNCVKKTLQDLGVNNATRRIDETLSRIDAIDEGAFQPMLEQPVMQALLIMLASVGLFAGEYLKVFG